MNLAAVLCKPETKTGARAELQMSHVESDKAKYTGMGVNVKSAVVLLNLRFKLQ